MSDGWPNKSRKEVTLKKYKISRDYWECLVEIDESFVIPTLKLNDGNYTTLDAMKEMILFWNGGASRLDLNDGDITKTFLQQLAREIQFIILEHNYNLIGVISAFTQREGWFDVDGSAGIKLMFVDDLEIEWDEFIVEEVAA